jgi:hypothetical protein
VLRRDPLSNSSTTTITPTTADADATNTIDTATTTLTVPHNPTAVASEFSYQGAVSISVQISDDVGPHFSAVATSITGTVAKPLRGAVPAADFESISLADPHGIQRADKYGHPDDGTHAVAIAISVTSPDDGPHTGAYREPYGRADVVADLGAYDRADVLVRYDSEHGKGGPAQIVVHLDARCIRQRQVRPCQVSPQLVFLTPTPNYMCTVITHSELHYV